MREPELGFLQFFDFHHEIGRPHRLRLGNDPSPDTLVLGIGKTHARSSPALHYDIVAPMPQRECTSRREAHAILLLFDLFRNANQHDSLPQA